MENKIPHPILQKISGTTLGKSWYKRVWIYFTETTKWKFVEDWKIELPNGMKICIPKGEITDGASIPWFLRSFATSTGPLSRAAYVHDFGYKHRYLLNHNSIKYTNCESQRFYDSLFKDIIIWTTGLKFLAYSAYKGVRAFGFIAWNEHRQRGANV